MTIKSKTSQKTLNQLKNITGHALTLGKLINSIRQCQELTQVELALKLGMSRQQLCDIEHDRKIISPKLAAQYADKLKHSREQFIRLALQALLDKDCLNAHVDITLKKTPPNHKSSPVRH